VGNSRSSTPLYEFASFVAILHSLHNIKNEKQCFAIDPVATEKAGKQAKA